VGERGLEKLAERRLQAASMSEKPAATNNSKATVLAKVEAG
jgi:hypothetical protein